MMCILTLMLALHDGFLLTLACHPAGGVNGHAVQEVPPQHPTDGPSRM